MSSKALYNKAVIGVILCNKKHVVLHINMILYPLCQSFLLIFFFFFDILTWYLVKKAQFHVSFNLLLYIVDAGGRCSGQWSPESTPGSSPRPGQPDGHSGQHTPGGGIKTSRPVTDEQCGIIMRFWPALCAGYIFAGT